MLFIQVQSVFITEHYFAFPSYKHILGEFQKTNRNFSVPYTTKTARLVHCFREGGGIYVKKQWKAL